MKIYLIRHGEVSPDGTADPPLSKRGYTQARAVGEKCRKWGVQLLCVSTMLRAQQTADTIQAVASVASRLDLRGLEEVNLNNPNWERVVGALMRMRVFAEAEGSSCVAIVAHGGTIMLSLLHWLGLGPPAVDRVRFGFSHCGTTKVVLDAKAPPQRVVWTSEFGPTVTIEWINRS